MKEADMAEKIMTVGELKPQFSDVLAEVRAGREIVVSYGRRKEKVAVIAPYGHRRRAGASADVGRAKPAARAIGHGLEKFIGSWVEDESFDEAVAEFRKVDPEMWR
jgi:antitoxin (DNA-binding transcriptional repressor) of toxin-antitoxin stability system